MRSLVTMLLICVCNRINAQIEPLLYDDSTLIRRWPHYWGRPGRWFPWRPVIDTSEPDFDLAPKFVLVTPAVLRVQDIEKVLLEAFGLSEPVSVSLSVYDFPAKSQQLWQGTVALNSDNNYSFLQAIKINPSLLRPEEKKTKFVQLIAQFGHFQEVKRVSKVSFLSGYIFIQTDKPVYNPGDKVRCRAFVSNADFQAFDGTVSVEIQGSCCGSSKYQTRYGEKSHSVQLVTLVLSGYIF